jgi:hypothetical protein
MWVRQTLNAAPADTSGAHGTIEIGGARFILFGPAESRVLYVGAPGRKQR